MASFKFLLCPLLIFEIMLLVAPAIDHRSDVNNFNTYGTLAPRHKGSYRRHHRHEHENEGNFAISGLKNLRKILIPTPPAEPIAAGSEEVVPQLKRKGNVALSGLRKLLLTTAAKEAGSAEVVPQLKRKGNVALTGLRKILLTTPAKEAGSAELRNTDADDGSNPNAIQSNAADDGSNPTDVQSNAAGDDTIQPQPEHHEISNVKKRINALNNYLHFLKRNGKVESTDGPDGSGVGTPKDTENGNFEHFSHESHDGDEVSHHKMSFNVMMKKGGQYERYDKGHNLSKIFAPRLDELSFMALANPNPPGSCCQPPPQTPTVCCVQPTNPPVIINDQPTEPSRADSVEETRTENAHPDPFPYISQEQTPYRLESGVSRSNEEEKPYKSEEETPYRKPSNEESKEASPEVTTEPLNLSIETTTYVYVSDEESVESNTESKEVVEEPTEAPEIPEQTTEKCPNEDHPTDEATDEPVAEPTQPSYRSEEASAEVSTEQPPNPPEDEPSNPPSVEEPSNPPEEEPSNPPTEAPSAETSAEKPKEDSPQTSIEQTTAPPHRSKEQGSHEGWIRTQTVIRKINNKKTIKITQTASDGPSSPDANVDDVGIEDALQNVDRSRSPQSNDDSQGSNESSSNTESVNRKIKRKKTTTTTQTSSNEQPSSPEVNVDSPNKSDHSNEDTQPSNENLSQESLLRRIYKKKTMTTQTTSNEKSSPEVIVRGASDEGTEKIVEKIKPWISDRNISIFAFSSKNMKHNSNNTGDDGSITRVQTNQKDMKGVVLKALSSLDDETKTFDEPPKFPFSEIEPKFKGYQEKVNDLANKSGKLCPELHPLKLIQDWSSTFKSAWPHFSQMKDVCLKYAEDLKLQLALCLDNVIHKKYGNRLPSDAGKGEDQDGQKFKRELEDQQKFVSTFNSEYMNPLVDMFAKMPELVHKANLK